MHSFELKCLGTGDGSPSPERHHAAFLYQFGHASLIVDCGEPICRSLSEAEIRFETIDRLLLSHLHFDHLGGLFM